ncbi:MAG: hypothetical protein ACR2H1_13745, partial [Limisphaerales bacterium]
MTPQRHYFGRLIILLALTFLNLAGRAWAQPMTRLENPPTEGTWFSMQLPRMPPFPYNPFPDLDVYSWGKVLFYDDRKIDYEELAASKPVDENLEKGPSPMSFGPENTNQLWLSISS